MPLATTEQNNIEENNLNPRKKSRLIRTVQAHFYPDLIVSSPEVIDYERLKSMGFQVILLDVDNTLVLHGSHEGDAFARAIVTKVEQAGLIPVIASNAREHRARSFADSLGVEFISQAKKPGIEAICQDLTKRSCAYHNALMVGDQLLTDVWAARKAKIPVILTEKRSPHEIITVKMKRVIERLIRLLGGKDDWEMLKVIDYDVLMRRPRS